MRILSLREEDRPREKLLKLGPDNLTESELLALILVFGRKGKSAIELANEVLDKCDGVGGLLNLTSPEIDGIDGIGEGKKCLLLALGELLRRYEKGKEGELEAELRYLQKEVAVAELCYVYPLNKKNMVLGRGLVGKGSVDSLLVEPAEVLRLVIGRGANRFVLAHTHPSGDSYPSKEDIGFTDSLRSYCQKSGVLLYDHCIVSDGGVFSFREHGLL